MSAGKRPGKSLFSLPHRRFLRSLNFFMRPSDISGKRRRERDLQDLGHHLSNRHAPAHTPAAKTGPAYFSQQQYEAPGDGTVAEDAGCAQQDGAESEDEDSPSKRRKVGAADLAHRPGNALWETGTPADAAGRASAQSADQTRPKPATETSAGAWYLPFIPSRIKSLFAGGR
jgi:hypothetical protein